MEDTKKTQRKGINPDRMVVKSHRFPEEMIDRTDRAANRHAVSPSDIVRWALQEWLDHDEKQIPGDPGKDP